MGASEWAYFVPYQPDISAAFRDCRHREFNLHYANRDHRGDAIRQLQWSLGDQYMQTMFDDPEDREHYREDIQSRIRYLESLPVPTTIDEQIKEFVQTTMEEGTGTILDMEGISDQEDFFRITPLTSAELIEIFATDTPDHDMVAAKRSEVTDFRKSQKGTYVIVFKDGQPDEIFFGGFSGD
jgi:hypothetical protein